MRTLTTLIAAALTLPASLAAQTGQFVVRLGHDTLAIEQYTRTAGRLAGEQVVRAPRTVHRLYTINFGPDGAVTTVELVEHNVSGAPGPAEMRWTAELTGDSAVVRASDGDSAHTMRVRVGAGALPFIPQSFGLAEELTRRAHAAPDGSYTGTLLDLGDTATAHATVTPRGGDSAIVTLGPIAGLRARVDAQGTLLGVSGIGTVMQVTVERVQGLDFATLGKSFAARSLGTLSPHDSVRATLAGAVLSVRYSRPSTRGRAIFGNVVPWGRVWRTGANEATIFETSADLVAGGTTIPAGKYSLWTIPAPGNWTLIVNKNTGQWGTDYDAQYDLARLTMQVEHLTQPVEQFTIGIEPKGKGGVLALAWENTRAVIPVSVTRHP